MLFMKPPNNSCLELSQRLVTRDHGSGVFAAVVVIVGRHGGVPSLLVPESSAAAAAVRTAHREPLRVERLLLLLFNVEELEVPPAEAHSSYLRLGLLDVTADP